MSSEKFSTGEERESHSMLNGPKRRKGAGKQQWRFGCEESGG